MGKSLTGKELGQGISQRKDGRFQARFMNRFGKRQTIYGKTINEIRQKLRSEQYEDEKKLNVVSSDMKLDEWFDVWMETCKKSCRESTRRDYTMAYNRIKDSLGWRKLSSINLILMQQAFNEIKTDTSRKSTRRIMVDMYNKAMDAELVVKNIARQVNTVVNKDSNTEERRVLTEAETEIFLKAAENYRYFYEFSLALETGMRIGEILGLKWSDIDFENRIISVNRTLVYFTDYDKSSSFYKKSRFAFHDPKTEKGKRKIPMTLKACQILKQQMAKKEEIVRKWREAPEGYEDLVFVTGKNTPEHLRDTIVVMKYITNRIQKSNPDFEYLTPHTLRHSFATRCIERGMNPKTLQIILGHANIQMTMNLYCHVTEDTLISEMSKFEGGQSKDRGVIIPIGSKKSLHQMV